MKTFLTGLFLFFAASQSQAQLAIKINTLYPIGLARSDYHAAFDIGIDKKLSQRYVLRLSFNAGRSPVMEETIMVHPGPEYVTRDFLKRSGLRYMVKRYSKASADEKLQKGFYWGVFGDVMAATITRSITIDGVPANTWEKGKGMLIGGGLCIGYSLKWNNWFIEPNLGLGMAYASGNLRERPNPEAFIDLSRIYNISTAFSPTHFELHAGYEF